MRKATDDPRHARPRIRAQQKSPPENWLTSESQKKSFSDIQRCAPRAPRKRPQTPRCQKRLKIGALAAVSTTIIALLRWPVRVNHTTTHRPPRCRRSASNSGIPPSEKKKKKRIPRHVHVCSHTQETSYDKLLRRREWLAACQLPEQSLYSSVVYAPRWHSTTWYRFFLQMPSSGLGWQE